MNIKKYTALMRIGFKIAVAYRFHGIVSIIMTPVSLIVFYFLWQSIYSYTGETLIRGFTFEALIGYYALSMIIAFFTWSHVDKDIESDVRHGHLIFKMLQPVSHCLNSFFIELGIHSYTILIETIPIFLIGYLFFYVPLVSAITITLFFISLMMAAVLYYQFAYFLGLSAFWLKRIDGIRRMRSPLIAFLSGGILPLTFFPVWYTDIHHLLPFQYMRYVPIMIYLEQVPFNNVLLLMLGQFLWILGFAFIIKIIWNIAYKKFSGVGT